MRLTSLAAIVVVLGLAASAGIGFSDCGGKTYSELIWINPSGTAFPASHTNIYCAEAGKNTPNLALTASDLGPGDGCLFGATLANIGNTPLSITVVQTESTPRGYPTFSTCFSFSYAGGPPSGRIPGGGGAPYTFTIEVLPSASSACARAVATVQMTFSGSSPCQAPNWAKPPSGSWYGPDANLQHANLVGLNLSGFDMAGDNLQGADMMCDDLQGTNLGGANMQGVNLAESNLVSANLKGANLQCADLADAILSGANFQGANLQGANLQGSVVTGFVSQATNFNGANLQGVNLAGVSATGYITATGANIAGAVNVASCVATSGTSVYCDKL